MVMMTPRGFVLKRDIKKITQDNHIDLAKYFWNLYQNGKYYVDLASEIVPFEICGTMVWGRNYTKIYNHIKIMPNVA